MSGATPVGGPGAISAVRGPLDHVPPVRFGMHTCTGRLVPYRTSAEALPNSLESGFLGLYGFNAAHSPRASRTIVCGPRSEKLGFEARALRIGVVSQFARTGTLPTND
jgi:hypothetical protein